MATCVLPPGSRRKRLDVVEEYPDDVQRPQTRGECANGPRPCPWVSCRWHLAVEVTDIGSLRVDKRIGNDVDLEALPETCALDVADRGETTLEAISELLGMTKEGVRQIEIRALRWCREQMED